MKTEEIGSGGRHGKTKINKRQVTSMRENKEKKNERLK